MKVDFIVAGAQKGGTTALCSFLRSHPDIFIPDETPHYFYHIDRVHYFDEQYTPTFDYEVYHKAFAQAREGQVIGDAAQDVIFRENLPAMVKQYNPDIKLLVMLRHPIDRAFSAWRMSVRFKEESLPFSLAIRLEEFRLWLGRMRKSGHALRNHTYKGRSLYARQFRNLYKHFGRSQILVLLNEDLKKQHAESLAKVYDFLGVAQVEPPAPRKVFAHDYAPMSESDRRYLAGIFRPDILELQELIGRDLSHWLKD